MAVSGVAFVAFERATIFMHGTYMLLHIGVGLKARPTSRTYKLLGGSVLRDGGGGARRRVNGGDSRKRGGWDDGHR